MNDQWDRAVRKLIALTDSGELRWMPCPAFCERHEEIAFASPAFAAAVRGKQIVVFEHLFEDDDLPLAAKGSNVAIVFVGPNREIEWRWPAPKGRFELLETIRYRTSNADEFLKEFLADPTPA
jgi:hypothetical protein